MGALGGLYRSTPQGYNGNSARRRAQPSVSSATVFSADWFGTELTGRARHLRVMPAVEHCSRASNDASLVMGSWLQLRRLASDYYSHSPSCLFNGAWDP